MATALLEQVVLTSVAGPIKFRKYDKRAPAASSAIPTRAIEYSNSKYEKELAFLAG